MVLFDAAREVSYLKKLLKELQIQKKDPTMFLVIIWIV